MDRIQRAALRPDRALGPWQPVAEPLPRARGHVHQTPVIGNRIYSAGGSMRREVSAAVYVGRLTGDG